MTAIIELIDLLVGLGRIKAADRDSILASREAAAVAISNG